VARRRVPLSDIEGTSKFARQQQRGRVQPSLTQEKEIMDNALADVVSERRPSVWMILQ
jgi:hypothetical protein